MLVKEKEQEHKEKEGKSKSVFGLAYFSTQKMEAIYSSEVKVKISLLTGHGRPVGLREVKTPTFLRDRSELYGTTRRYTPEVRILWRHIYVYIVIGGI
jgi:hypothetical protein